MIQSKLEKRSDLVKLNSPKVIVEVGVYRGHFSLELLKNSTAHVHLVDPWKPMGEETQHATYDDLIETLERVKMYKDRVTIHPQPSLSVTVDSPDLVYIDGDHSYEGVMADCYHWYKQLSPNGFLAGHDIFTVDHLPVTKAVMDFARKVDRTIYLINGDKNQEGHHICAPSWYLL